LSGVVDFCTYFDSRYLSRALALYASLRRHAPQARLHALCLDDDAFDTVARMDLPGIAPIKRGDFEDGDEELLVARSNRTLVEYYFTCSPSVPLYILNRHPEIERIFYIDADCYFFSSPDAILEDWGNGSIYIVGHRFPEPQSDGESYGKFNVGIVGFRNDVEGRRCLERWRQQCNAWCYDRIEDGKYADQKYLDAWPDQFQGVVVSQDPGVNVAPWNRVCYQLGERDGVPCGNNWPIVFYHFHGLKVYQFGLVAPQDVDYGTKLNRDWIRLVYAPYLRELMRIEKDAKLGHYGDMRFRRPLSLAEVATMGRKGQFLVCTGRHWREIPPHLLEALGVIRRGTGLVRNLIRWLGSRPAAVGDA